MVGFVRAADRAALGEDRSGDVCGVPSAAMSESIEADTSVSERSLDSDMRKRQQVVEHDLARFELQVADALAAPAMSAALTTHGRSWLSDRTLSATPPAFGRFRFRLICVNFHSVPSRRSSMVRLPLAMPISLSAWPSKPPVAGSQPELAELVDPGEQRGEIGRNAAFGHRLKRENRACRAALCRTPLDAPMAMAPGRRATALRSIAPARSGAKVTNGCSPPTSTLICPSGSIRIVMLASTRRKLSARGLANSRLAPEIPTSALGATATVAPQASRSTMSRSRNAVRPCASRSSWVPPTST